MTAILYEVVITVGSEIRADYLSWLRQHMDEMKTIDGFTSATLFNNSENENELTCHYGLTDMAAMEAYLNGAAKDMRADGIKRFGDKFIAKRRILTKQ
ncbi:MAG: hypothetical protein DHS20C05_02220 [Hyphococcus sp.]|nr:MAG: hypothetical protein DHS20C05_02220 [Marinicaulis sp.]